MTDAQDQTNSRRVAAGMDVPEPASHVLSPGRLTVVSFACLLIWSVLSIASLFAPSMPWVPPVMLLASSAFFILHGAARYGWRGIVIFIVIGLLVSNLYENLSVETGFPYGFYVHHTEPKLFNFPIASMPGQLFMYYVCWICGLALVGRNERQNSWLGWLAAPVAATFVVTGLDASIDPIFATIHHAWSFRDGGGYFGVPLSNCLGWLVSGLTLYLACAAFLPRGARPTIILNGKFWWTQPSIILIVAGISQPLALLNSPAGVAVDPTGVSWRTHDLLVTMSTVSICTAIFVGLTTLLSLWTDRADARA